MGEKNQKSFRRFPLMLVLIIKSDFIMENSYMDESKLLRYFSGDLDLLERERVNAWIEESKEHEKIAKEVGYICSAIDTARTIRKIDAEKDLLVVHQRIGKRRQASVWGWLQRIAVILFIPLLLSVIYNELKEDMPQYMEVRSNHGMVSSVDLPDGSKVWMNSGSCLKYPVQFTGEKREVFLDGEAFFSVRSDEKKRFVVNTSNEIRVEVLGTEFNMDAYSENDFISTTLVKGSVKLLYDQGGTEQSVLMKPTQKVVYDKRTHSIETNDNVYVLRDVSWKDGRIVLRNTSLSDVLWMLSKRFNVEFVIEKESLKDNSFTGTFDDQSLVRILDHLKISSKINYRFEEKVERDSGKIGKDRVVVF